jgi:hypothetical protein
MKYALQLFGPDLVILSRGDVECDENGGIMAATTFRGYGSPPQPAVAKNPDPPLLWSVDRPDVLVVACSDGRLQASLDHFLSSELGVKHYDRMYMPGGSGALIAGGCEFLRAEHYRRDLFFLLNAHGTDELILLAHGAAEDGPPESTCALYRRLMPIASLKEIREQQIEDVREFLKSAQTQLSKLRVRAYRVEVQSDLAVRYVEIV